jgi:hypothetical protein
MRNAEIGQKTEDRMQMTEGREQKTEFGMQNAEIGQKTDAGRQRTEGEKLRWWERLLAAIIKQEDSGAGLFGRITQFISHRPCR